MWVDSRVKPMVNLESKSKVKPELESRIGQRIRDLEQDRKAETRSRGESGIRRAGIGR